MVNLAESVPFNSEVVIKVYPIVINADDNIRVIEPVSINKKF